MPKQRSSSTPTPTAPAAEPAGAALVPVVVPDTSALPVLPGANIRFTPRKEGGKLASVKDGETTLKLAVVDSGRTLDDLEYVVRKGLSSFVDAGVALLEIRARALWKEAGYKSFSAYATERFNLSRARAYQLLDVAQVAAILIDGGVDLPRLANRLEFFAPLKHDPAALVDTYVEVADQSPTGDPSDLDGATVRDAVADAANAAGADLVDNRTAQKGLREEALKDAAERAKAAADAKAEAEAAEAEADGSATSQTTEPATPRRRVSGEPARNLAGPSSSPGKAPPTKAEQAGDDMRQVVAGFRAGAYDPKLHKALVQDILGYALAFMAGEWETLDNRKRVYVPFKPTVSQTTAKGWYKKLAEAQAQAKAEREAKALSEMSESQRAQVEKNKATVAADQAKQGAAAEEAPAAPDQPALSPDPQTVEEAYAISDALQAWLDGGKQGQSPVTGQQIRRAEKLIEAATAEEAGPEEEAEAQEAEPMTEAEIEAAVAEMEAGQTEESEEEEEDDDLDDDEESDDDDDLDVE